MIRLDLSLTLSYEVAAPGADFVFNVHAAHTPCQVVQTEQLRLSQAVPHQVDTDPVTGTRYLRLHAEPGPLIVGYTATIDLLHHRAAPDSLGEVPVREMPPEVMRYIYPSRYCESDRLGRYAIAEFGSLWQGYRRVQAIQQWCQAHVAFQSNTSDGNTSAVDTLIGRAGVCRDFAHLMIAMCRALSIPARFTTGTDYGADPALGPPDFHAYVEVFLGQRWVIFDPSGTAIPMAFLRFGTGRDAADVAFATIFGSVQAHAPLIDVRAIDDLSGRFERPVRCEDALSTDDGRHPPWATPPASRTA